MGRHVVYFSWISSEKHSTEFYEKLTNQTLKSVSPQLTGTFDLDISGAELLSSNIKYTVVIFDVPSNTIINKDSIKSDLNIFEVQKDYWMVQQPPSNFKVFIDTDTVKLSSKI